MGNDRERQQGGPLMEAVTEGEQAAPTSEVDELMHFADVLTSVSNDPRIKVSFYSFSSAMNCNKKYEMHPS